MRVRDFPLRKGNILHKQKMILMNDKYLKHKHIISKMITDKQVDLGINNKILALSLNIPQYRVFNIIKCQENISIKTMTKLEIVLDIKIFEFI